MTDRRLTFTAHLTELRSCLIRSLIALAVGMTVSLIFAKDIFRFLQKPLLEVMPPDSGFIATLPFEALIAYLKVGALAGVFLASPVILHQIWKFVAPGLHERERRTTLLFTILSTIFFVGGALFGYFEIFPVGFKFMVGTLNGTGIRFLPQMKDYLSFISRMLLVFGGIFEMPLVILLLAKAGLVKAEMLRRSRRYVIVALFLVAGILTPGPDVLSQLLLAIPLLVLFELSVIGVKIMERRTK